MSIKISVIIPCYNSISTLPQLIKNIQSFITDSIEVIFVDDGSTDGSLDYFKKHFPSAKVIEQTNHGLAHARNVGAKEAKGLYLQFIDADDTIYFEKISSQFNLAVKTNSDVIYSDWRMIIVNKVCTERPEKWIESGIQNDYINSLLVGWWNPFHSYLFKKEAYFRVGGSNTKLINAQDFDIVLRMAINGCTFQYQPGNFSNYYRYLNTKSLARGSRKQYWKNTEEVILNALKILETNSNLKVNYKKAAAQRLFHVARNVYKFDKSWNDKIMSNIKKLDPYFYPSSESIKFRILYKIAGYKNTEKVISILLKN